MFATRRDLKLILSGLFESSAIHSAAADHIPVLPGDISCFKPCRFTPYVLESEFMVRSPDLSNNGIIFLDLPCADLTG